MKNARTVIIIILINVLIAYISSTNGLKPVTVNISPQHLHFRNESGETITCKATEQISTCEFRVFDLTEGNFTQVYEEKYKGKGLTSGECAITLWASNLVEEHYYMATCRVRSSSSDWTYASMSVYKSYHVKYPLTIQKPEIVVSLGEQVKVVVKGSSRQATLKGCSFKHVGNEQFVKLFNNNMGNIRKEFFSFEGDGDYAFQKTCGVTIYNATEDDNGIIVLKMDAIQKREICMVSVIVAKAPTCLLLTHETVDNGSETLLALCTVIGGRPAPLITWYLGGAVVPDEAVKSNASEEWVWSFDEQTVKQTLTLTLNDSLKGKEVKCSATHKALIGDLQDTFEIGTYSSSTSLVTTDTTPSTTTRVISPFLNSSTTLKVGLESVTVTISPQHLHVRYEINETITCKATEPITKCEFRVFDLTNGALTNVSVDCLVEEKNYGKGLKSGECATTLLASKLDQDHYYMATCRVRSSSSDWAYASMSVYKSESIQFPSLSLHAYSNHIPLVVPRSEVMVVPGSSLNVTVRRNKTGVRLTYCEVMHPSSTTFRDLFRWNGHTCDTSPEFYGQGSVACSLTCGLTVPRVTEEHNGIFVLRLGTVDAGEIRFVTVVVAKAEIVTKLSHTKVNNEDGSVTLNANCTVTGSRPAPLITWYLGNDLVPDEDVKIVRSDMKWTWPFDEQVVKQRLSLTLSGNDVGKEVRCSAKHVSMNVTIDDTLSMRYDYDNDSSSPLLVVIAILAILLVAGVIAVVIYAWRRKLCCFASSKATLEGSVKYRRSLDASLKYEETGRQPDMGPRFTISSMDRSSAATGLEYAEIRVSVVQRCLDQMGGDPNRGTMSAETGDRVSMRPNSLYLARDDKT